jgi:hypothetical protein
MRASYAQEDESQSNNCAFRRGVAAAFRAANFLKAIAINGLTLRGGALARRMP